MFCSKCGSKVIDGSKFCFNCGAQFYNETEEIQDFVIEAFNNVFENSLNFGDKVYILKRDRINRKIEDTIENFFLDYRDEVPLLVFDYSDNLKQGSVITNYKIAWRYYDKVEKQDIWEISNILVERAVLARVMRLVDGRNRKSGKIFLTGIRPDLAFVEKFKEFIEILNY